MSTDQGRLPIAPHQHVDRGVAEKNKDEMNDSFQFLYYGPGYLATKERLLRRTLVLQQFN
jgi:hypothetical protein